LSPKVITTGDLHNHEEDDPINGASTLEERDDPQQPPNVHIGDVERALLMVNSSVGRDQITNILGLTPEQQKARDTRLEFNSKVNSALRRLNYEDQKEALDDFEDLKISAFVLSGSVGCGQRMCADVLIQHLGISEPNIREFSLKSATLDNSSSSLIQQISQNVDLPPTSPVELIVPKIIEMHRQEDVVFRFERAHGFDPNELKRFVDEFWKPLCIAMQTEEGNYRICAILLDHKPYHTSYTTIWGAGNPPEHPIVLPVITPMSVDNIFNWLKNNRGLRGDGSMTQAVKDKFEKSNRSNFALELYEDSSEGLPGHLIRNLKDLIIITL
jgi:hypothetical protein